MSSQSPNQPPLSSSTSEDQKTDTPTNTNTINTNTTDINTQPTKNEANNNTKPGPPIPFSSLPLNTSSEKLHLNAWGLYGEDDELGFLNRQTDEIIAAAAQTEIRCGRRVALDAGMKVQGDKPLFGRHVFKHHIYQKVPRIVHDDTWHFNTQSATQWDGLRHFGYQEAARFYNNKTVEDIASSPTVLGIQNTARRGGIMGRGILIDFHSWWASSPTAPGYKTVMTETHGKGFRPFERSPIKLRWLKAVLDHQGTQVKWGDILFIRSGFMEAYANIPAETLQVLHDFHPLPPTLGGVEVTEELLKWIWDNFSAVVGDQPGFEQIPMEKPISAHEVLLAGWGCPIGEMFDLDELSRVCAKEKRWSFFLSSQVLNVEGGVASPPCAVAIF